MSVSETLHPEEPSRSPTPHIIWLKRSFPLSIAVSQTTQNQWLRTMTIYSSSRFCWGDEFCSRGCSCGHSSGCVQADSWLGLGLPRWSLRRKGVGPRGISSSHRVVTWSLFTAWRPTAKRGFQEDKPPKCEHLSSPFLLYVDQ